LCKSPIVRQSILSVRTIARCDCDAIVVMCRSQTKPQKLSLTYECRHESNKKDGYRQRNVRQFLQSAHNLATSGESRRYAVAFSLYPFCEWRHLATSREFKAHFGLPWIRPGDNRGKFYMDGKRIQCLSNASQHVHIYLQPFTSYSEILVVNCNIFLPLAFNAPVGCVPIGIPGKV